MSDNYDPYHKWLGIPPAEQPPNYYRLLGLNLFESDLDVIENGSDRQMAHLRSFQTGPRMRECQRLLNEVAAARVALLDAQKKASYDQLLRASLTPAEDPPPVASVPWTPADSVLPTAIAATTPTGPLPGVHPAEITSPAVVAKKSTHRRKQSIGVATLAIGGTLGLVALLACGYGLRSMLRPQPRPVESAAGRPTEVSSSPSVEPVDPLASTAVTPESPSTAEVVSSQISAPVPTQPANAFVDVLDEYDCDASSQPRLGIDRSFDATKSWRLSFSVFAESHPEGILLCWGDSRAGKDPICIKAGPDFVTGWVQDNTNSNGGAALPKISIDWSEWHEIEIVHDAVAKVVQLRVDKATQNVPVAKPPRADRVMPVHLGGIGMGFLHGFPCRLRNLRLEQLADPVNLVAATPPAVMPVAEATPVVTPPENPTPPSTLGDLVNTPATAKLAVPSKADLAAARLQIERLFANDLSKERSRQESATLADQLQIQAVQSDTQPAMRYAMLEIAVDVAASGGAVESASKAIQGLERAFTADLVQLKAGAAQQIARVAKEAWEHKAAVELLESVIDECLFADRYDLATSLADAATDASRKSKDSSVIGRAVARSRDVKSLNAKYESVRAALKVRANSPEDPAANETIGRHLCLVKGRWDEGLPYLAKSSVSDWRDAANGDLRQPTTPDTQATLGTDWLKVALQLETQFQLQAYLRAEHWLRLAVAQESGIKRLSLEQQIKDIGKDVGKLAELPTGAVLVMTFEPSTLKRQGYVLDVSGHGYVGTVNGAPPISKGIAGNAFSFDGGNAYIEVASTPWLSAPLTFTLTAWVNATSWKDSKAAMDYVLSKDDWRKGSKGYVLRFRGGGFLDLTIGGTGWVSSVADERVDLGTWHQISATNDGELMRVFVDGEQSGVESPVTAILPSDYPFRIGKSRFEQSRAFHGIIDEVAVFNRALSPDEVRTVYRIGQAGRPLME